MAVPAPRRARVLARRSDLAAAPPLEAGRTLVDLFFDRAARWSDRPGARHPHASRPWGQSPVGPPLGLISSSGAADGARHGPMGPGRNRRTRGFG
jgi:hypothetical protein